MDVQALDPDFVIFPTYKWLLGPYGRAFLYIAKRHQDGIPLEQTALRPPQRARREEVYFADLRYVADARRFDMGERDHFISHGNGGDRHGDDGGMGRGGRRRAARRC